MPPYINLREDVVEEVIHHSSEGVSPPAFISKEDVISDTPS